MSALHAVATVGPLAAPIVGAGIGLAIARAQRRRQYRTAIARIRDLIASRGGVVDPCPPPGTDLHALIEVDPDLDWDALAADLRARGHHVEIRRRTRPPEDPR